MLAISGHESGSCLIIVCALLQQFRSVQWSPLFTGCTCGVAGADGAALARRLAQAWLANVRACWQRTGMMAEKHNALRPGVAGGGGEYPVQASQSLTLQLDIFASSSSVLVQSLLPVSSCTASLRCHLTLLIFHLHMTEAYIAQSRRYMWSEPPPVVDADGFWVDQRRGAVPAAPVWLEPWRGSLCVGL